MKSKSEIPKNIIQENNGKNKIIENQENNIIFNESYKDKDKEKSDETINNSDFNFNREPCNNNIDNNNIIEDKKEISIEKSVIMEDKINKKNEIQNTEEKLESEKKEIKNKNSINNNKSPMIRKIKNNLKFEGKRYSSKKKEKTKNITQKNNNNKNQIIQIKDNNNIKEKKEILGENEKKEEKYNNNNEYPSSPKRVRNNTVEQKHINYKNYNSNSKKKSKHSKEKGNKSDKSKTNKNNKANNKLMVKIKRESNKNSEKHSNNDIQYNSEDISNFSQSLLNSTKKQNISENTGSVEELTLKDEDLDKILKFVNNNKEVKFKTIPEEENETHIENQIQKNNFRHKTNRNNFKYINEEEQLKRDELIEKIKRNNDERIRNFLEKIIYSKLLDKKEIIKRKRKVNLVYKDKKNQTFKLFRNSNFIQNFHKNYLNESEDDNFSEEQNEESSEKSDEYSKNESLTISKIEDDIPNEKIKKELIYDNSYLFKKDDKKIEIKKEVEDILKGVYDNYKKDDNNKKKDEAFDREKFEQKLLASYIINKKFKKRRKKRKKRTKKQEKEKQTIFVDQELDKQMYLRRKELYEKQETKELKNELKEKTLDWRVNYFFGKVKEMKNLTKEDFLKQFDKYAEFDINDLKIKRDKEDRIRDFILGLNDYRVARKVQRKLFDTYIYKEPILIENCSPDKNNSSLEANSDDKK